MPSLSSESSTDSRRSLRSVSVKQSGESEEKITKEQDEEKKLGSSGAAPFSSRLARSSVSYRKISNAFDPSHSRFLSWAKGMGSFGEEKH